MANITTTPSVGSAIPTSAPATPLTYGGQTATQMAEQSGVSSQQFMDYQKKYPGVNPDALIGTILMDKQKASATPTPSPAPAIVTSDMAKDRAASQTSQIQQMAGGGDFSSTGDAKSKGYMGDLAYNPQTGRYEPAKAQEQAPKEAKAQVAGQQMTGTDAMSDEILKQLQARPGAIDLATQNQIKTIQEIMGRRRSEMEQLNKAQQGATEKLGAASGRARYAPDIQGGIVSDVAAQGLKRVGEIDAQEQSLIAEAMSQAEEKKFAALNQTYEFMQKLKGEKAAALKAVKEEMDAQDKERAEKKKLVAETSEKTFKNLAESGYDLSDQDIAEVAAKYGTDFMEAKASYGATKREIDVKNAKSASELKIASLNAAKGLMDVRKQMKAGETITVDGIEYSALPDMDTTAVTNESGEVTLYQVDKNAPLSSQNIQKLSLGNIGSGKSENIDMGTNGMWKVFANGTAVPITFGTGGADTGGINVNALVQAFPGGKTPAGTANGWCVEYQRACAEPGSLPPPGTLDTIQQKRDWADKTIGWGDGKTLPSAGDYVLTNEDSTWGHMALISSIGKHPVTGKTVMILNESNYQKDQATGKGVVGVTRTLEFDPSNMESAGGKILGFHKARVRTEFSSQPVVNLGEQLMKAPKKEAAALTPTEQAGLRKEISADKDISQYNDLSSSYNQLSAVYESSKGKIGSKAALDQSLITLFNKMLDPTSVVREGEYARSLEGQAALVRLEGYYNKLKQGGSGINDAARKDMVDVSKTLFDTATKRYNDAVDFYVPTIEASGGDPSRFIKGYKKAEVESPALSVTVGGKVYKFKDQASLDKAKAKAGIK